MTPPSLDPKPAFVREDAEGGGVYNEAAFRYFLGRERRRAQRLKRPLILVLVKTKSAARSRHGLSVYASTVLEALSACVREVDFVGWYREDQVAAALVTVGGASAGVAKQTMQRRVTRALHRQLPPDTVGDSLRVRVVELGEKPGK